MKGTWTSKKTIIGDDGKTYWIYVPSWPNRDAKDFDDLSEQRLEFEVKGNKIVNGTLKLLPPPVAPAPEDDDDEDQEPSLRELRLASPVIPTVAAISLTLTQECTLKKMPLPAGAATHARPTQAARREDFGTRAEFKIYTEQNFAQTAALNVCPACRKGLHSASEPQTFWQYYRLQGNSKRRGQLKTMLSLKLDECQCVGWVFPHPPNNVYRRTTDAEHEKTLKKFNKAKKVRAGTKIRARDSLLKMSGVTPYVGENEDRQKKNKLNHLIPKSGGGCPVGRINLQAHEALCKICKSMDDLVTKWQSEDKAYFSQIREGYKEKCPTDGCNYFMEFNVTECPTCQNVREPLIMNTCPDCKELLPKHPNGNSCPNCRTDLG